MKPGIIYRTNFSNLIEARDIYVDIFDNSVQVDDSADENIFELQGISFRKETIDNEESKVSPIRTWSFTFQFANDTNINFTTFSTGEDDRFTVHAYIKDVTNRYFFKGFLEQSGISEPFLPQVNLPVTLRAVDGLSRLRTKPLVNFDGDNPMGVFRFIDYIAWCLSYTGNEFNINVINNIREKDNPGQWQTQANFINATSRISTLFADTPFYKVGREIRVTGSASNNTTFTIVSIVSPGIIEVTPAPVDESAGPTILVEDLTTRGNILATCSLDAKTWEDEINTCVNMFQVLEKIMFALGSFIEQSKGEWYIQRVHEYRNDFTTYQTVFDFEGNTLDFFSVNREKAIGNPYFTTTGTPAPTIAFTPATTSWMERPGKFGKLTFLYKYPKEIICNIDFSRGDFIADLADETIESLTYQAKSYEIDCWSYLKNIPNVTQDSVAYIKRLFYNGYEKERFVHMEATAVNGFYHLVCAQKAHLQIGDKFNISVSFRHSSDLGGGSGHFILKQIWVRLYGIDGTYWNLYLPTGFGTSDPQSRWVESNSTFTINQRYVQYEGESDQVDFEEWQTASGESAPLPVSGQIEIILLNDQTPSSQTKDFSSLQFEYIPLINGSFQKYRGQSNKFERSGNYSSFDYLDKEIDISESPKRIFKGAILKESGTDHELATDFYEGQEFLYPADGWNNLLPFGKLVTMAFFNQFRNECEKFEASCQGIDSAVIDSLDFLDMVDLLHRYFIRDLEPATNLKPYMLVSLNIDFRNSSWTATMIKVFDNNIGYIKDDPFEFKYLSE